MVPLVKYPRTPHIEGSRLQPGDEDLDQVPFDDLAERDLVVEEKLDGANAGLRFDGAGRLLLQSRGHFLSGGPREKHFALFKRWAGAHAAGLWAALGERYALYGEWTYAKHTVYYDALPHYFHEFDVLDTRAGEFLSTPRRRELLSGLPVVPAPVLHEGPLPTAGELLALVRPSAYKSAGWREALHSAALARGLDAARVASETDRADEMEGLYIKVEEAGVVRERYKYVRAGFHQAVADSGSHWLRRPILPNGLRSGVDLFAGG